MYFSFGGNNIPFNIITNIQRFVKQKGETPKSVFDPRIFIIKAALYLNSTNTSLSN